MLWLSVMSLPGLGVRALLIRATQPGIPSKRVAATWVERFRAVFQAARLLCSSLWSCSVPENSLLRLWCSTSTTPNEGESPKPGQPAGFCCLCCIYSCIILST